MHPACAEALSPNDVVLGMIRSLTVADRKRGLGSDHATQYVSRHNLNVTRCRMHSHCRESRMWHVIEIDFDFCLSQHHTYSDWWSLAVRCCVRTITSLMLLLWSETDENVLLCNVMLCDAVIFF